MPAVAYACSYCSRLPATLYSSCRVFFNSKLYTILGSLVVYVISQATLEGPRKDLCIYIVIRISAKYLDSGKPKMRNDIFAAIVAQRLNIALPRTKWLHCLFCGNA